MLAQKYLSKRLLLHLHHLKQLQRCIRLLLFVSSFHHFQISSPARLLTTIHSSQQIKSKQEQSLRNKVHKAAEALHSAECSNDVVDKAADRLELFM